MTNFACDKTESDFDFDSCSYSLERRHSGTGNKYNNYTLGLLCNIQPGKSSICHINFRICFLLCFLLSILDFKLDKIPPATWTFLAGL